MEKLFTLLKETISPLEMDRIENSISVLLVKCLKIEGKDAISFINNISTFNITKLNNGRCQHGLFLNKFGKVIADAYLYKMDLNTLYLVTLDYKLSEFIQYLQTLILINDVKIENVENWQYIVVPSAADEMVNNLKRQEDIWLLNDDTISGKGYYVTTNDIFFIGTPTVEYDELSYEDEKRLKYINFLRLKNKIPYIGVDFDDKTFASEIEEWINIDLSKGCFIGQEYLARVKFQGNIHKKLVYFSGEKKLIEMAPKNLLHITSSYYDSATNETCGFGYLNMDLIK